MSIAVRKILSIMLVAGLPPVGAVAQTWQYQQPSATPRQLEQAFMYGDEFKRQMPSRHGAITTPQTPIPRAYLQPTQPMQQQAPVYNPYYYHCLQYPMSYYCRAYRGW